MHRGKTSLSVVVCALQPTLSFKKCPNEGSQDGSLGEGTCYANLMTCVQSLSPQKGEGTERTPHSSSRTSTHVLWHVCLIKKNLQGGSGVYFSGSPLPQRV